MDNDETNILGIIFQQVYAEKYNFALVSSKDPDQTADLLLTSCQTADLLLACSTHLLELTEQVFMP